jgi:hypothetical protein
MNETQAFSGMALSVQVGTAAYALRLNRLIGVERIGWALVALFTIMTAVHLFEGFEWTCSPARVEPHFVQVVVSVLLLIGLTHIGVLSRGRFQPATPSLCSGNQVEHAIRKRTQDQPTRRCSEPESAGWLTDKWTVSRGWLRSLTLAFAISSRSTLWSGLALNAVT